MRHREDSQERDTSCASFNNDRGHRVEGRLLSASSVNKHNMARHVRARQRSCVQYTLFIRDYLLWTVFTVSIIQSFKYSLWKHHWKLMEILNRRLHLQHICEVQQLWLFKGFITLESGKKLQTSINSFNTGSTKHTGCILHYVKSRTKYRKKTTVYPESPNQQTSREQQIPGFVR